MSQLSLTGEMTRLDIARLRKPDRYGRALAGIRVAGKDIAAEMVGAGHARPYVCPGGRCAAHKPWCGRRAR
jgi:endonuclease YncB( thermonuclease family)